jgi:TonB family protein
MKTSIARFLICASASAAIHGLTFEALGSAGTAKHATENAAHTLEAYLVLQSAASRDSDLPYAHKSLHRAAQPEPPQHMDGASETTSALQTEHAGTAGAQKGISATALPAPEKWYTADEVDVRALPLHDVTLSYPEALSTVRVPGRVRIALFIDENGWIAKMQVVESEPARLFDEAAIRAWRDVRFSPALKSQLPVKSEKLLDITFTPY